MQTKGKWNIQNFNGVFKNFADAESDDARAWMRSRGDAKQVWDKATMTWVRDAKTIEREEAKALRDAEREEKKKAKANDETQ